MKKSVKIIVKGTVQGIFFRQFTKEHADNLKLMGFCRNLENNDVEVVVEGEGESIEKLINKIKEGPEHSQIRHVGVEERKWSGDFSEFKVLRF